MGQNAGTNSCSSVSLAPYCRVIWSNTVKWMVAEEYKKFWDPIYPANLQHSPKEGLEGRYPLLRRTSVGYMY